MNCHNCFFRSVLLFLLTGWSGAGLKAEAPKVYSGTLYQATVANNQDSGLVKVLVGGTQFIMGNHVCDIVRLDEKASQKYGYSSEEKSPLCTFKDQVFTSTKDILGLRPKEFVEKAYAKVDKKITFSSNEIKVEIGVEDQQPMQVIDRKDTITFITKALQGMRVEGTLMNGEVKMALIPRKYSRQNWRYNYSLKQLKIVGENLAFTIKSGENCKVILSHWGGPVLSIGVVRIINRSEQQRKPGDKMNLSYTITFEKVQ